MTEERTADQRAGVRPDGIRVTLRPFADTDMPAASVWLPEAVAAIQSGGSLDQPGGRLDGLYPAARIAAVCIAPDEPIGFVAWRRDGSSERAEITIVALAIRRDARNLGYGAEAVQELERLHPAGAYRVEAPRANGLALYFWLRAGYRPVRADDDATRARDPAILWMTRAAPPELKPDQT